MYTEFGVRKYQKATLVFDRYDIRSTIKDITHLQRQNHKTIEVCFTGDMTCCDSEEMFLANKSNKHRFIHLLSNALWNIGLEAVHTKDDADCLIVKRTLEVAKKETTVLVGEDTDLLVLLLYTLNTAISSFVREGWRCKVWNIKRIQEARGQEIWSRMLFLNARSGCDTTSRLFSVEKGQPLKMMKSDYFKQQAFSPPFFLNEKSSHDEVAEAGENVLVSPFGGKERDSLNELRYVKCIQKVSTSYTSTQPNVLPPTSSAAKFLSFRTFFQAQTGKFLNDSGSLIDKSYGVGRNNGECCFPS